MVTTSLDSTAWRVTIRSAGSSPTFVTSVPWRVVTSRGALRPPAWTIWRAASALGAWGRA